MEKVAREKIKYTKRIWREIAGMFFVAKNRFIKNKVDFQPSDEEIIAMNGRDRASFKMNRRLDFDRWI